MASTSFTLPQPLFSSIQTPSNFLLYTRKHHHYYYHFTTKCTNDSSPTSDANSATPEPPDASFPSPSYQTTISADKFPIEKRRKSTITRDKKPGLVMPEPRNREIGWKRTKQINLEKPKGWKIADFLEKLETLMGMEYGTTALLAKVGEIVAERSREEAEVLREKGEVEDRMITELDRVLKLMEMDLAMVKAASKEETLLERIEQAKARCRQAILVALSF